jgi:Flp pilus assembly protein TadD
LQDNANTEEYLLKAYDYDPEDDVILDNLAQYYIGKNDYTKARIYAEKAFEAKEGVDILHHLVLVEEHDGNINKAQEYAESMIEANLTSMNDVTKQEMDNVYSRVMGLEKEEKQQE